MFTSLPQLLLRFKVHGWDNDVRGLAVEKGHDVKPPSENKLEDHRLHNTKKVGGKKQVEGHFKKSVSIKTHEHMFKCIDLFFFNYLLNFLPLS